MKKRNFRIVVISLSLILGTSFLLHKKEHDHNIFIKEELTSDPLYFRSCSAGDIYIGTSESFKKHGEPDGIMVIDKRNSDNPNMVIINSCNINSKQKICEVLQTLQVYNECNPSEWNRTLEAMKNEWELHNILYSFSLSLDHTIDVDLDNDDESKFDSKVLTYTLKNYE